MAQKKESATLVDTLPTYKRDVTTNFDEIQEKFVPRLDNTFQLADAYDRLGMQQQAELVRSCGDFLLFRRGINEQGELADLSQLHKANFCKQRLCPMCAWRRGLKMYSQAIQIANALENEYSAVFLTLTVPSVSSSALSELIHEMQEAWHKFTMVRPIKKVMQGYIKSLEITYNPVMNTYHPHFHVVIFVNKDYGSTHYLSHEQWLQYWRDSMQDQSIQFVNIKKIYENESRGTDGFASAVAEVCKYPFKPSALDYDISIETLSHALKGVRTISMGGIAKKVAILLKLDDIENGDLVRTDIEYLENYTAYIYSFYGRGTFSKQYELFKQTIEVIDNE